MCGIVGFVKNNCLMDVYDGLKMLEYRGYDSAGVAYIYQHKLHVHKKKGRIERLRRFLYGRHASVGMGHTRWATHGAPTTRNAHPHCAEGLAVVHNGIITNYTALRAELEQQGVHFASDTDTEVIVRLLALYTRRDGLDMPTAIRRCTRRLAGSWAVAVMDERQEDAVYLFKKDNPLIVGQGDGFYCFASDTPALVKSTHRIYKMQDGQIACLRADNARFWQDETPIVPTFTLTKLQVSDVQPGRYGTYMLKEMAETPAALRRTWRAIVSTPLPESIVRASDWVLIGCGTAYHACLCAAFWQGARYRCCVSSEFVPDRLAVGHGTVVVAVSQSGETADTLHAVRAAKQAGAFVVGITNVPASGLTAVADWTLLTEAGAEIAVAATKSFNTQLLALRYLSSARNPMPDPWYAFAQMDEMWRRISALDVVVQRRYDNVFLLGKGRDYAVCLEGALKIKEVTYLPCDACYTGEIKHGPLACVSAKTLVVAVCTDLAFGAKTQTALHEVQTRGARTLLLTGDPSLSKQAHHTFLLPTVGEDWAAMAASVPLQYLAYRMAVARRVDPDKPRNLAKSVTVE